MATESKDVTSVHSIDNTGQGANKKMWNPPVSINHLTLERQGKVFPSPWFSIAHVFSANGQSNY